MKLRTANIGFTYSYLLISNSGTITIGNSYYATSSNGVLLNPNLVIGSNWWLRTAYISQASRFQFVASNGNINYGVIGGSGQTGYSATNSLEVLLVYTSGKTKNPH